MEQKGTTDRGEQAAPTPPVAALKAESQAEIKKGPGGRRNPLIRPDLAKEIQAFSLLNFVRALLDEARIWLNLEFGLDFPFEILAAFHLDLLDRLLSLGLLRQRHFENAVLEAGLDLVRIDRVGNPD